MKVIKKMTFLVVILMIASCGKNNCLNTELPDCIMEEITNNPILAVYAQELNGDVHYWLNTGALAVDGSEFIVNMQCDTVCYFGGRANPECLNDYEDDWVLIWPK